MRDLGDKAPIVEAILYIEFIFDAEVPVKNLETVADAFVPSFPEKNKIHTYESSISFEEGNEDEKSVHFEGFRLDSEDHKKVIQIRLNGLAYSLLKPYSDGNMLINEYKNLWQQYSDALSPKGITKIGLRNVNKFDIPASSYSNYFKIAPNVRISGGKPLLIGTSNINCIVCSPAHDNAQGNISTFLTAKEGSQIEVIFDLDVFKTFDNANNDFKFIEYAYKNLRSLKNDLFYGNITDQAYKELFNGK